MQKVSLQPADLFFIAQEILVDHASYPTDRIAHNSHLFRPLGLGLLEHWIVDHDQRCGLTIHQLDIQHVRSDHRTCYMVLRTLASAEIAGVVGTFAEYPDNAEPMLRVMQMHRNAVEQIDPSGPSYSEGCCSQCLG